MKKPLEGEYYSHPELKEIRERNFKKYAAAYKVLAMSDAKRCPVCYGKGVVEPDTPSPASTAIPGPKTCHGCGGRGWVVVP